jgi:energy-coupling factor transporter transmembrane protein EcfT
MASLIPTMISNGLKYILSPSRFETRIYNEVYSSIVKSITLLLILSILSASTMLLIVGGFAYYLWEQQFTFWQIFGIILTTESIVVLLAFSFFRNTIQKTKLTSSNENNEGSKLPDYDIVTSFIEGFNSKK